MKSYSNKIHKLITENKKISLKLLLEEDTEKKEDTDTKDSDSGSDSSNDLFSDASLDDNSDDTDSSSDSNDSSGSEESADLTDDISQISPEDVEQKTKELKGIMKSQEKSMQDAQSSGVEGSIDAYATAEVLKSLGESYYRQSLKNFLFEATDDDEEKSNSEKEDEENEEKLKDAQEKVNDYVEGQTLNVNAVVDSMENAIEHFTTLFDINRIVYEKFAKVIISYCGSKADDYLQQIKDEMADRGYMGDYAKETLYKVAVGSVKNQ